MAWNLSALIRRLRCSAVVLPEDPFTHPSVTRSAYPSSKGTTNTALMGSDGGVTLGAPGRTAPSLFLLLRGSAAPPSQFCAPWIMVHTSLLCVLLLILWWCLVLLEAHASLAISKALMTSPLASSGTFIAFSLQYPHPCPYSWAQLCLWAFVKGRK